MRCLPGRGRDGLGGGGGEGGGHWLRQVDPGSLHPDQGRDMEGGSWRRFFAYDSVAPGRASLDFEYRRAARPRPRRGFVRRAAPWPRNTARETAVGHNYVAMWP